MRAMIFLPWIVFWGVAVAVVAIMHDIIVDRWKIKNIVASATPVIFPASGVPIVQAITVSFDAENTRWFAFGPMQPAAYSIELELDPQIVRCEVTVPQYCPVVTGGVGIKYQHVQHQFVVRWDTIGVHYIPVNIKFDGMQLTNTGGPGTELKTQVDIRP